MKRFLLSSLALLSFSTAIAQVNFTKEEHTEVMYDGWKYVAIPYHQGNPRESAYEIRETGSYNFIGDESSEFETYKNVAFTAKLFLDRRELKSDLNKIRTELDRLNRKYAINRVIDDATELTTRFTNEIASTIELTRTQALDIARKHFGDHLDKSNLVQDIITGIKDKSIKDKKDLEDRIILNLVGPSAIKAQDIIDSLSVLQLYINDMKMPYDFRDASLFRERLYNILRQGNENGSFQLAYIVAGGDDILEVISNKLARVGYWVLDEIKGEKGENSEEFSKFLKRIGVNIEDFDKKIEDDIQAYVSKNVGELERILELEDEKFNPANPNSLAYKFLEWITNKTLDVYGGKLSYNGLILKKIRKNCSRVLDSNNNVIINLYTQKCGEPLDNNYNWVMIDLPYDFKKIKNKAKISFRSEELSNNGIGFRVYLVGYFGEKGDSTTSPDIVGFSNSSSKIKWDLELRANGSFRIISIDEEDKKEHVHDFNVKNFKVWNIRIIPSLYYFYFKENGRDIELRLSDLKIDFN